MSRELLEIESFEDHQKIFYVTYGQKRTILHPLEVEIREKNFINGVKTPGICHIFIMF